MGVGQGKNSLGKGEVGEFVVGTLVGVLHGVGQKLRLVDQMRVFRCLYLGEFCFPDG